LEHRTEKIDLLRVGKAAVAVADISALFVIRWWWRRYSRRAL
jgi:hypothetical protein